MAMRVEQGFSGLTGAGVSIGVIDSGYAPGKRDVRLVHGVNFSIKNSDAEIADYTDNIGHGTASIGIIHAKAPAAEIYPVKIFDTALVSDVQVLTRAIRWCVDRRLNLINLSLGTTEAENKDQLQEICDIAFTNNVFIIAAASNDGQTSYPASLARVFGVTAGKVKGKYDYYFNRYEAIQFIARGDRQRLDWLNNQQVFMGGTSFAAPHVTAILALMLQKYPGITYEELIALLEQYTLPHKPPLMDGREFYDFHVAASRQTAPMAKLSEIHVQNEIHWIKKAIVFPYNKEMHSLVRYRNLLPFQISGIVDVIGKRTIGKDSGEVIGAAQSGIIIQKNIEHCFTDADTLILGYVDEISRIKRRDVLQEMLELALLHEKNVYSLTPITDENYPALFQKFAEKKLHIASPVVTVSDFQKITTAFDWRSKSQKPVIGVFGTSPQQGKFTAQLALRQELQQIGYKVGQLGTEHQSALFGFDFTFPNGYEGGQNIRIPMDLHITLLQSVMVGIERNNPHIIIVGGQSGIIPYNYAEKSQGYTLSSLIMIMGTVPDAYILVVNSIDDMEFIQDNINVLKALGKGKTILLVFSDKKKEVVTSFGRSSVIQQQLTRDEITSLINKLEDRFSIPATEIISDDGRKKMVKIVENFFAAN